MNKTYLFTSTFSLMGMAAASATVIAPVSVSGPAAGASSSLAYLIGDNAGNAPDNLTLSGSATTLPTGTSLADAQATTHYLAGNGHFESWYALTSNGLPVFVFDLGSDQNFGTALVWNYGNNGGGAASRGNQTKSFEMIFHTEAQGNTFDFGTEAIGLNGSMPYEDGPDADGLAAQTFQFSELTARYVALRITENHADTTVFAGDGSLYGLGEVRFATESIPEPSTTALLGLAGLGMIIRRRR
ncbi:hypothetical protein NT6N_20890 [Oceaniferula spumae]|uniref:Ice-binding protein C-terminal domain-containing protein n=1 Tax=Oceaniferula spumae TaxID=2979115 RepID=A0AAT9FM59_9BACT